MSSTLAGHDAVGHGGYRPFPARPSRTFAHDNGRVLSLAITANGDRVLSGGVDGFVRVWNTAEGTRSGSPIAVSGRSGVSGVDALAVSPDGGLVVAGTGDGAVGVWRLRLAGRPEYEPPEEVHAGAGTRSLAWYTPDTDRYLSAGSGPACLRRLRGSTTELREPRGADGVAAVVTPRGETVVADSAGYLCIRYLDADGKEPCVIPEDPVPEEITSLAVACDGKVVVTATRDGRVRVWNVETGKPVGGVVQAHSGPAVVAASAYRHWIATAGVDGIPKRWALSATRGLTADAPLPSGVDGEAGPLVVDDDGRFVVTGDADGRVHVWNARSDDPADGFADGGPVTICTEGVVVATSPKSDLVACSGAQGTVVLLHPDDRWPGEPVIRHDARVRAITHAPDGTLVSGADDGTIRVYDPKSKQEAFVPGKAHPSGIRALAVDPDSSIIVSGGLDGAIRMWSLASRTRVGTPIPKAHPGGVQALLVLDGGDNGAVVVSGGRDGRIKRWRIGDGRQLGEPVDAHADGGPYSAGVRALAFRRDTGWVISGGHDGSIRIWDARAGWERVLHIDAHNGSAVVSLAVDSAGRIVSGSRAGWVRVWSTSDGEQLGREIRAGALLRSLTLDRSGEAIVGGYRTGMVAFWRPFGPATRTNYSAPRSDAPATSDKLGMHDDARTIGKLLTAEETSAPLSVALIGDWGSGKSTFMELVRDDVRRRAERDGKAAKVRQVRFNAWHYSDVHLWTGLIEHLFRELRPEQERPGNGADEDGTGRKDAPATNSQTIRAKLLEKRSHRDRTRSLLERADRLHPGRDRFRVLEALKQIRLLGGLAGWRPLRRLWELRKDPFGLAVLGLLVAGSVLWATGFLQEWIEAVIPGGIDGWISWLTAAVIGAAALLRGFAQTAETVNTASRESVMTVLDADEEAIRSLENQLIRADPSYRVERLLAEINEADAYSGYRGLTGRVHQDLLRLSEQLTGQLTGWRIILYIDDLDRCVSARVVEVLQAINLLLGLKLFMVVVAVDPRWLLRALDEYHGALLDSGPAGDPRSVRERHGRPHDYLDKIFHIPFAVRSDPVLAGEYVRSLLIPERSVETSDPPSAEPPSDVPSDVVATGDGPERTDGAAPVPLPRNGSEAPTIPPPGPPDHVETVPSTDDGRTPGPEQDIQLSLKEPEIEFLGVLGPMLPTPRAMKKLANLYRLLRLEVADDAAFLGDGVSGPFQVAALLLTVVICEPGRAGDLLAGLDAARPADGERILDTLRGDPRHALRADQWASDPAVRLLIRTVEELRANGCPVHDESRTYRQWARPVTRFSFETYDMFTARAPTDGGPSPERHRPDEPRPPRRRPSKRARRRRARG